MYHSSALETVLLLLDHTKCMKCLVINPVIIKGSSGHTVGTGRKESGNVSSLYFSMDSSVVFQQTELLMLC